jgi:acetyltransferase-like isoleucine patch superfamily enzyme
MNNISEKFRAYWNAFAPLSCLCSPRPDAVTGLRKWWWLAALRKSGALVDPSVDLRCRARPNERIVLRPGAALDRGIVLWIADECGGEGRIIVGERVYIGPYCFLGSCHRLEIGCDTLIGAGSYVITVNHRTDALSVPLASQGYRGADVIIGSNVWLGAHVVVLPGVIIGDNAIVGAGAVVTKDVPAGARWAGVPAKPLEARS